MIEPMTDSVSVDELKLAQLACAKLAGIVQGTLSIGLAALVTGVPDPRGFLETQFRVMTGYALVLHTVSGKPGGQQLIHQTRDKSRAVLMALADLEHLLLDQPHPSADPSPMFPLARDVASRLCDALREYADLVKLDASRIDKVKGVVLQVFDGVENMKRVAEPSVSGMTSTDTRTLELLQ